MKRVVGCWLGAWVLCALFSAAPAAAQALAAEPVKRQAAMPPIEAFFERPSFTGGKLAPDGRRLAFLVGGREAPMRLLVLDLQTLKTTAVAAYQDADIVNFLWVSDQRLVYDLSVRLTAPGSTDRGQGLFAVNADGRETRQLVEAARSFVVSGGERQLLPWSTRALAAAGQRDSGDVFVVQPENIAFNDVSFFKLSRVETRRGSATEISTPPNASRFVLDQTGQLRAVVTAKDNDRELLWRNPAGEWKSLERTPRFLNQGFEPLMATADGTLYGVAPLGDKRAVFAYDPVAGKRAEQPLFALAQFDVAPDFVATRDKLLGIRTLVDAEVTHWLDPQMKALQAWLDQKLPNTANRISVPYRSETPFVLVEAFSDVEATTSYLLDTAAKKLTRLGQERPVLSEPRYQAQAGTMAFFRFKARDGLAIPTYLTLPAGPQQKNLPMVVLVHGGPYTRGPGWVWQAEVQFLASRGYAVLQPEFRGSVGFGQQHFQAGWKQWGLAMQNDVADAVNWAVAQGHADPKRVCIAGASYGGYAALMGLVNDPQLYRCAVSWVGVTDLQLLYDAKWSDVQDVFKSHGMPTLIGDPVKDAAQFKATSPLQQAARIRQPVLLAYGGFDVRVPIVHGERLRDALKPHNPDVAWVVYAKEGHGWAEPANNTDFWRRVEGFLQQHLGSEAAKP